MPRYRAREKEVFKGKLAFYHRWKLTEVGIKSGENPTSLGNFSYVAICPFENIVAEIELTEIFSPYEKRWEFYYRLE